ncbi:hypothetical protein ACFLSZ_01650 [Candidatus Bipolaricaulota bacterium]
MEKELLPYLPSGFEHVLKWLNPNIVVDYDDAVFANYQNNPSLKRKLPGDNQAERRCQRGEPVLG